MNFPVAAPASSGGFYLIRRKKARIFRLLEKKLQVQRFD